MRVTAERIRASRERQDDLLRRFARPLEERTALVVTLRVVDRPTATQSAERFEGMSARQPATPGPAARFALGLVQPVRSDRDALPFLNFVLDGTRRVQRRTRPMERILRFVQAKMAELSSGPSQPFGQQTGFGRGR